VRLELSSLSFARLGAIQIFSSAENLWWLLRRMSRRIADGVDFLLGMGIAMRMLYALAVLLLNPSNSAIPIGSPPIRFTSIIT